jgi:hypothetical protein
MGGIWGGGDGRIVPRFRVVSRDAAIRSSGKEKSWSDSLSVKDHVLMRGSQTGASFDVPSGMSKPGMKFRRSDKSSMQGIPLRKSDSYS